MTITRRRILQASSLLAAPFLIAGTATSPRVFGANDRLRIAVVGVHGRGKGHIAAWLQEPNVEIAYLVDPDKSILQQRLAELKQQTTGPFTTKGVSDIRVVLDDKHVDAVSIATPNHWHALMTIWSAQAGKHVYVEKPMSHSVEEGHRVLAAQKKYGIVLQHGTQRRSDANIAGLHEMIHAGHFGKLKIAYAYSCKPREGIGFAAKAVPPANLDWNLWQGPAQLDAYHENLVHYNWHWFWRTGNGEVNNQGTHLLDVAQWAIDKNMHHPVRVRAIGGRFAWQDMGQTPNTLFAIAEYANGQQVLFNLRNVNYEGYQRQVCNEYYFEDGGKIIDNQYYAKGSATAEPLNIQPGKVTPGGCWSSFIAACRAHKPSMVNGSIEDAHRACVLGHLINHSYQLGKELPFNQKAVSFGDDVAAAEHFLKLHQVMAKGVGLPQHNNKYTVGPWLEFDPATERYRGEQAQAANKLLRNNYRRGFEIPSLAEI